MASLTLTNIEKSFGTTSVLQGVEIAAEDGELVVLVGPSGCGKSTLLRIIAGLETLDGGSVNIGERDVTRCSPRERDIAMVFQSYALYPHMSVRDNIAFGLSLRKVAPDVIEKRVTEVSKMLGLEALLERFPKQLSGGQRQRVAMGRAVAREAKLFLFDEPLSNLDAALRAQVRVEIRKLHQKLRTTTVYVTHDQVEAMTLADRLVVMNGGVVEQQGPPSELYDRPDTKFVAGFLGSPSTNFLPARIDGDALLGAGWSLDLPSGLRGKERSVELGLRPHDVELATPGQARSLALEVEVVESTGPEVQLHGAVGSRPFTACLPAHLAAKIAPGEQVSLVARPEALMLFDAQEGRALRA